MTDSGDGRRSAGAVEFVGGAAAAGDGHRQGLAGSVDFWSMSG